MLAYCLLLHRKVADSIQVKIMLQSHAFSSLLVFHGTWTRMAQEGDIDVSLASRTFNKNTEKVLNLIFYALSIYADTEWKHLSLLNVCWNKAFQSDVLIFDYLKHGDNMIKFTFFDKTVVFNGESWSMRHIQFV